MSDYVHWCCLGALCEFLPQAGQPGHAGRGDRPPRAAGGPVLLLPVRQRHPAAARRPSAVMEDILHAAGADEVITIQRFAHLVGGARMAADERHGVVDGDLPQLRRAEPLHHRRERAAHPGQRQPRPDHHGRRRPGRRPAAGRRTRRPILRGSMPGREELLEPCTVAGEAQETWIKAPRQRGRGVRRGRACPPDRLRSAEAQLRESRRPLGAQARRRRKARLMSSRARPAASGTRATAGWTPTPARSTCSGWPAGWACRGGPR